MTKKCGIPRPERRIIVETVRRETPDLHKLTRAILTQAIHDQEKHDQNHISPSSNNTSGDSNPRNQDFPRSEPPPG